MWIRSASLPPVRGFLPAMEITTAGIMPMKWERRKNLAHFPPAKKEKSGRGRKQGGGMTLRLNRFNMAAEITYPHHVPPAVIAGADGRGAFTFAPGC